MTEPMSAGWPRLTEDLPPVDWGRCPQCHEERELVIWQEHDDRDRPEPRAVKLCVDCSDAIIEDHPRLYRRHTPLVPLPGVMDLCRDCIHRDGTLCRHPDLTINGGPGLDIRFPEPMRVHVTARDRSRSGWENFWKGPPTECAGRETVEIEEP
ncbi:MAG: hypothetical protein ACLFWG_00205 [Longimicrobiales bacterium]